MTAPPSPVVPQSPVTILDVYTKQIELAGDLKLIQEQLKTIPDHESRIRRLEESRAKVFGAAITISVIASAAGTWVGVILTRR